MIIFGCGKFFLLEYFSKTNNFSFISTTFAPIFWGIIFGSGVYFLYKTLSGNSNQNFYIGLISFWWFISFITDNSSVKKIYKINNKGNLENLNNSLSKLEFVDYSFLQLKLNEDNLYSSALNGFSFQPPPGWKLANGQSKGIELKCFSPDTLSIFTVQIGKLNTLNFNINEIPKEYFLELISYKNLNQMKLILSEKIKFCNQDAIHYYLTLGGSINKIDHPLYIEILIFSKNRNLFQLIFKSPSIAERKYDSIFFPIKTSFKLHY